MIKTVLKHNIMKQLFGLLFCVLSGTELLQAQCTFSFTPSNPCPGEEVTFNVQNPEMGAVYTWDIDGDGMNDDGNGTTVKFTYPYSSTPKNYIISLYKNGTKCTNTSQTINVKEGFPPTVMVAAGGTLQPGTNVISACTSTMSGSISL